MSARMNARVRVYQVDAFTHQPFTGNPAGVVLDADQLDAMQMQAIAREMGNGDTAFVLPADGNDHDLRVRFFTPRAEVSFVGHATVAAHAVLHQLRLAPCRRQKQRSGIVTTERRDTPHGSIYSFTQPAPPVRSRIDQGALGAMLAALGLDAEDLDERCPAAVAGEQSRRALVAVREGAILARLKPDLPKLAELSASGAPPGYFVFTLRPESSHYFSEARMFCPALGIPEDPVSGNAHAMLAVLLDTHGLLPGGAGDSKFTSSQGRWLDRPGELHITFRRGSGTAPGSTVSVGGGAAVVFATSIDLPGLPGLPGLAA